MADPVETTKAVSTNRFFSPKPPASNISLTAAVAPSVVPEVKFQRSNTDPIKAQAALRNAVLQAKPVLNCENSTSFLRQTLSPPQKIRMAKLINNTVSEPTSSNRSSFGK